MALQFTPVGITAAANPLREAVPLRAGLLLWGRNGIDAARTIRNRASIGAASATIVGAPTYNAAGVDVSNTNYIADAIAETADMTLLFVGRSDDTQAGNTTRSQFGGYGSGGSAIYVITATSLRALAAFTVSGVLTLRTVSLAIPAGFAAWRLYALTVQSGVGMTLYNLTDGTSAFLAETSPRSLSPTSVLRTGSGLGSTPSGTSVSALRVAYSTALTLSQLQTLRTGYIAPRMAELGITV